MPNALVLGGATGLVGQALARVLTANGWHVETLGRTDGNLLDIAFLESRLTAAAPDVVFNAVAWTQVDDAEEHPDEALLLNRTLPDALARILSAQQRGWLVHFSTDFVFSGQRRTPWTEEDPPCPASVYGKTKLAGEQAVLNTLPERSSVIRSAWLFGHGRKNFVDTVLAACRQRDSVSVVHDQTGSPTYSLDLAHWSLKIAEKKAAGLWHAVNGGQATWCELASEANALMAFPCRVEPVTSAQWPQKAVRPTYSVLDTTKLGNFLGAPVRPWPLALRDFLFSEHQADS
ncbi:MAG: dTDP-4-dehydrorhamnose reductase [Candidatus Desulfovibrio kirbyi]|uniref:dTDP-4-dehydrorhamnose reductase n=1 Tax=Candidatus Desulfovibrio kirbyi TaxID=2696086 RepID=A0A6L2R4G8_9BACT|nr:MAG: dTDP-4-dehydrorhamnose reductase [Candidatus Desulfovibrio kirbyi]